MTTGPAGVVTRRPLGVVHGVLALVYVVVTVWWHARSTFLVTKFASFSDWTDYQAVERASLTSRGFWAGIKPPGYPLLIKVLGEGAGVHWGAIVISTGAWIALALAVAAVVRTRAVSVLGVVVVLGCSLSERIQVWNDLAASESLSISLFVLAFAAGLVLVNPRVNRRAAFG